MTKVGSTGDKSLSKYKKKSFREILGMPLSIYPRLRIFNRGRPNSLTLETKSLLASLFKGEEFPLFSKDGLGEIFRKICLLNYGLLSNFEVLRDRKGEREAGGGLIHFFYCRLRGPRKSLFSP
jgi:hypothetical protein